MREGKSQSPHGIISAQFKNFTFAQQPARSCRSDSGSGGAHLSACIGHVVPTNLRLRYTSRVHAREQRLKGLTRFGASYRCRLVRRLLDGGRMAWHGG